MSAVLTNKKSRLKSS